jgi:hypothetical protein
MTHYPTLGLIPLTSRIATRGAYINQNACSSGRKVSCDETQLAKILSLLRSYFYLIYHRGQGGPSGNLAAEGRQTGHVLSLIGLKP